MKKFILIALVLVLSTGGYFLYNHFSIKERKIQAEEFFSSGRRQALEGNDIAALKLLQKAVDAAPDNAEFNFFAGISARNAGKKEAAYNFFTKAWQLGMKEPEVFLNMNATSSLPRLERSKYFQSMVHDLQDVDTRLELNALLFFQQEKLEEAAVMMEQLFAKNPQGIYAEFYAQILISLGRPQDALQTLEKARELQILNENCYIILLEMYIALDQQEKAAELYREAEKAGMNTTRLTFRYGRALFYYSENDKAADLLQTVIAPRLFVTSDITSATILKNELKSSSPFSKIFLNHSTQSLRDSLTTDSDNRFDKSKFIELATNAVNHFCQDRSWFDRGLIPPGNNNIELQNLLKKKELNSEEIFTRNALTLIANFPDSFREPDYNFTTHSSRLFLQTIYSADDTPGRLKKLVKLAAGSRRWLEGERYYGEYLLDTMSEQPESRTAEKSLRAATALLQNSQLISINLASTLLSQGKVQEGLVLLDKASTNNLIISRSPVIGELKAAALAESGNLRQAQLLLISLLKRGYITENLIYSLSNISLTLNDKETTQLMLRLIRDFNKQSPRFYLLESSINMQEKDYQQALKTIEQLDKSTATDELKRQGLLVKAEAELLLNLPEKALTTIEEYTSPATTANILRARILHKLARNTEALNLLKKEELLPQAALELYATLLAAAGDIQQAEEQLQKILELNPENTAAHLNLALIYNGSGKFREAIQETEKALSNQPDNLRANLLLAQLSLREKKTTQAIALAQKVLTRQPENRAALQLLPTAYNEASWYERAIISADFGLKKYPEDPFLLMQKAVALVSLSDKQKRNNKENTGTARDDLAEEIAALTSDVLFTGAMKEFSSDRELVREEKASNTMQGLSSHDLLREAERILQPVKEQPAVRVYILDIELRLGEHQKVLQAINKEDLTTNELFSLGVITDRKKEWEISTTAYHKALQQEPENPIIMNNYAWAAIQNTRKLTVAELEQLKTIAEKIPQMLKGDIKAINTAAQVYLYLKMPEAVNILAETYPDKFKYSPKLDALLQLAAKMLNTK